MSVYYGLPVEPFNHEYLSTSCLHTLHHYCKSTATETGAEKRPAECKFCKAPCVCWCHSVEVDVDAAIE